jgi:hypothetical protein
MLGITATAGRTHDRNTRTRYDPLDRLEGTVRRRRQANTHKEQRTTTHQQNMTRRGVARIHSNTREIDQHEGTTQAWNK